MRTIGIRELKARLSGILRDVQRGEHILVTDRGRVVAELRTPDASQWSDSPRERARARLAAGGNLRVAESNASVYQRSPVKARSGLAQDLLDADRGDR
ncbi:MAG: type II toxin-antitoxin system prevent-host-death family antitoxin [Gemmatimonadaceae bacterium]